MPTQVIQVLEHMLLNLWFVKEIFELLFGAVFYFFEAFVRLFVPHPRKDVEGEIVLVTGAASGLGKWIAKELGRLGATLVLWDVNWEKLDKTAKELRRRLDVRVYAYACDCSRRTEVYRVAEMVKKEVGDVSILINNAGVVTGKYAFTDAPDNLVDRTLRVNAAAHFWQYAKTTAMVERKCSYPNLAKLAKSFLSIPVYLFSAAGNIASKRRTYKAFLPAMFQRNHGHLVCVSSHAGLFAMNGLADYCASKFASIGFAESIALELLVLRKEGIKTTIVCPYLINTTMFQGCRTKWPSLLPIMDQKEAAKKIVDAVLREKMYLMLPGSLYFLMALKSFMPAKLGIIFINFFGGLDLMDHFHGVPVPMLTYKKCLRQRSDSSSEPQNIIYYE